MTPKTHTPPTADARRRRPPLAAAISVLAVGAAVAMVFFYAPTELVQGDVQRIFYLHLPAAWIAYLAFVTVAAASLVVLVRKDVAEQADRVAASAAEIGVVATTIVLTTGPIWGHRVWGVPWVWDARLTSTLVLWAVYAGYLLFRSMSPAGPRRARLSAVIGIIGAIDIPVVHFSVVWWRTLHPLPTVVRPEGPDLPASMGITLLATTVAFTALFVVLFMARLRIEHTRARLTRLEERAQPGLLPRPDPQRLDA